MISAWYLLWILPLTLGVGGIIGVAVMCCLFVAKEADRDINENNE
jgi:hypothetical protein